MSKEIPSEILNTRRDIIYFPRIIENCLIIISINYDTIQW